jgi:hypothetical protein
MFFVIKFHSQVKNNNKTNFLGVKGLDNILIWLVWFLLISIVAFLLIPRRKLVQLLPFGIVAGFLLPLALLLLIVPLLNLWSFNTTAASSLIGIPLSLPLALIPAMMIFAYYVPRMEANNMLTVFIAAFTVITTLIQGLSVSAGIMRFLRWDLLASFLLTFSIYTLLALFILKYGVLSEEAE